MVSKLQRVAVLGSGVMGGGIAAQVANAGIPVVLLDVAAAASNRNEIVESSIQRLQKTGAFMHADNVQLIRTGNFDDDLGLITDCDWIIEAVIENLDIKHDLYRRIDKIRKPESIVSSNTSTIPLERLLEGQSEDFCKDFIITHFFNPPRYMRLLEVVKGRKTRSAAINAIAEFADVTLGKTIVECKDTPGFIANRIGVYWMQHGLFSAFNHDISVEEADAVMSRPVGIPKTGIFGLWDLVGVDLGPKLTESMTANLEPSDPFLAFTEYPPMVLEMIDTGYTGRKGKGGFYRINKEAGGKVMETKNLKTGHYQIVGKVELGSLQSPNSGLRDLLSHKDRGGRYAWEVLSNTLSYAASLVPEISDHIHAVDEAMKLGYAWKFGPFELIDQLGGSWLVDRFREEGRDVPEILTQLGDNSFYRIKNGARQQFCVDGQYRNIQRAKGVLTLADIKLKFDPIKTSNAASLWNIGDGVVCLEFHTKMNAMQPEIMQMIDDSIEIVAQKYSALVIYNEGSAFSVGANLSLIRQSITEQDWGVVSDLIRLGQQTYQNLQQAPFPVVAAPSGMALGGGCEVLLHCDAIQAYAETYAGLVEVGVGLIPAWGGCKEMLKRNYQQADTEAAALKAFDLIAGARVSTSAADAISMGLFPEDCQITMNRQRLLADAKVRALQMVKGYRPQMPKPIQQGGKRVERKMLERLQGLADKGKVSPHDHVVLNVLAQVLSGSQAGECSEDDLFKQELAGFVQLVRNPDTHARIEHMLNTGKPMRN